MFWLCGQHSLGVLPSRSLPCHGPGKQGSLPHVTQTRRGPRTSGPSRSSCWPRPALRQGPSSDSQTRSSWDCTRPLREACKQLFENEVAGHLSVPFHTGVPQVPLSDVSPTCKVLTLLYFSRWISFWSGSHPTQKAGRHPHLLPHLTNHPTLSVLRITVTLPPSLPSLSPFAPKASQ